MFDDPKKELQALEEELQALSKKDEDFEDFYAKIYDEFGDKTPSEEDIVRELLNDHPQKQEVPPAAGSDSTYADKEKKAVPEKKDNSIRNLCLLISLELLGIAGVAAFWFLRLL